MLKERMGLQSLVKRYKSYEGKELARRAAKKKKLRAYKSLKSKNIVTKTKRKFDAMAYTKAIGNPYKTRFPKAKKVLKKARKTRRKKLRRKVVVIYR